LEIQFLKKKNKHDTKAGDDQVNSLPDKANETQSTGVPKFEMIKVSKDKNIGITVLRNV
jgi:hypothetical protein